MVNKADENTTDPSTQVAPEASKAVDTTVEASKASTPAEKDNLDTVELAPTEDHLTKARDEDFKSRESDFKATADGSVVYHLDRDPNDPRVAEPARDLPSLDDEVSRGPAHGRISNDADHTETGKNFPA